MRNRLSVELEGAASLLPTAGQVQTAGFSVVSGIGGWINGTGGRVIVAVHVAIVIRSVSIVCRQTETDLTGAIAVGMRGGDRRARVRVRVA